MTAKNNFKNKQINIGDEMKYLKIWHDRGKEKGGNNGDILEIVSVRCGFVLWGKRG